MNTRITYLQCLYSMLYELCISTYGGTGGRGMSLQLKADSLLKEVETPCACVFMLAVYVGGRLLVVT